MLQLPENTIELTEEACCFPVNNCGIIQFQQIDELSIKKPKKVFNVELKENKTEDSKIALPNLLKRAKMEIASQIFSSCQSKTNQNPQKDQNEKGIAPQKIIIAAKDVKLNMMENKIRTEKKIAKCINKLMPIVHKPIFKFIKTVTQD